MAARLNKRQQTSVREHIRATELVKRVQGFALGEIDPQTGKPIKMDQAQVRAALHLIDQRIGKAPQEITGEGGGPLTVQIVRFADLDRDADSDPG